MLQLLIEVPDTEKFYKNVEKATTIDSEAEVDIKKALAEHTDDMLFNTQVNGNKKLICFVANNSTQTLSHIQDFINKYSLQWTILAANDGMVEEEGEMVVNTLLKYKKSKVKSYLIDDSEPYKLGKFQGQLEFENED